MRIQPTPTNSTKYKINNLTKKEMEDALRVCGSIKQLAAYFGVKYSTSVNYLSESMTNYGLRFSLPRETDGWTADETNILVTHWKDSSPETIKSLLPNRSWNAIKCHISKCDIDVIREYNCYKLQDVSQLLDETPLAYYWMGFLLADGHFTETRIHLALSVKDASHVEQFRRFIDNKAPVSYTKKYAKCQAMDYLVVPKIREKFCITNRKTYEPSDISFIQNDNLFVALMIGFIDGDGCIKYQTGRKDFAITIKCHSSWLENLNMMKSRVCSMCGIASPDARINNCGYAHFTFSNTIIQKFLKNRATILNLPVLKRKWDKIDMQFVGKQETSDIRRKQIFDTFQNGTDAKTCAGIYGVSLGAVHQAIREHLGTRKPGDWNTRP